jgi:uncharacterized glyoxalase superfamily protein PhnB
MTFKNLIPNIMVEDVNKTLDYYKDLLGFNVYATNPEQGKYDWAMAGKGNTSIMFQSRESLAGEMPVFKGKDIGASLTFYIGVDNVDELYKSIKDRADVVMDMRKTFYGAMEFGIKDLNGYILVFAQNQE